MCIETYYLKCLFYINKNASVTFSQLYTGQALILNLVKRIQEQKDWNQLQRNKTGFNVLNSNSV